MMDASQIGKRAWSYAGVLQDAGLSCDAPGNGGTHCAARHRRLAGASAHPSSTSHSAVLNGSRNP